MAAPDAEWFGKTAEIGVLIWLATVHRSLVMQLVDLWLRVSWGVRRHERG